ncbi:solute carrier family 22 member 6 [Amyelois transitella]|uniref:solute carrier family 22 member 6 n=1 Tax=Amyelois transitella TaxID=680683 RepID=UPI00298FF341|nr:solute carrier family 22 member 6 [Amyelois transitella]
MSGGEGWSGGCGWWQARLALLLALPVALTGLYNTNYVFLAAPTEYRCIVAQCEDWPAAATPGEVSSEAWQPAWRPWALPPAAPARPDDACLQFRATGPGCGPADFDNTTLVSCDRFLYRTRSSIVAEFGLACAEWKRALVGTVHNVGMLISLPIIGFISDRWGRRAALVTSAVGAGLLGLVKSFVNSYYTYLLAELAETILGASVYPAAFVLMIEWLGVEQRIFASLVLGIPLSAGAALLALLDYLSGYWRLWARIAYPPSFLLLLYPWLLPESVRWLASRGRHSEALSVLKQAAKCNNSPVSEENLEKMLLSETEQVNNKVAAAEDEEGLIRAFFKYGALRRRLFVCFAWWMSAVFVFYGLAVRAHALSGSAHVNYALVAAAELPALLLNTLLLDRIGRRPLLTFAFLLTAVSLIAISCIPQEGGWRWLNTVLYLSGKVGAAMSLNALYVYTAELFPTRARQRLLAACSTCGRLGSLLAPLTPLTAAYRWWLPTALFGALPLCSAMLTRLVPDTLHRRLPDTFSDLDPAPGTVRDEEQC